MTDFWTDKRALVTGGHGFMGQVVVSLLHQRGARVFAPSRQHFDLRYREQARDMLRCTNPEIVIHLAANVGGIGYNRAHPAELAYENLAIGMNTVEAAYHVGVKRFVGVGTVCFPSGTTITCNPSVKSIEDIHTGDQALTDNGTYQTVSHVFATPYTGKLKVICASGVPHLPVTPNHPFRVCLEDGTLVWKRADAIRAGDNLFVPRLHETVKQDDSLFSEELCELIGIFVAEGSVLLRDTHARGSRGSVYFSFGEEPEFIERVRRLMRSCFGLEGHLRKMPNQKGYQLYYYSLPVARFFAERCYNQQPYQCHNIQFPHKAMLLPNSKLIAMVRGYFRGDGHHSQSSEREKIAFTTVSRTLAWQLRQIFGELDIYSHVTLRKPDTNSMILGRKVHTHQSYGVWITSQGQVSHFLGLLTGKLGCLPSLPRARFRRVADGFAVRVWDVQEQEFSGMVYNLSVENQQTYVAGGLTVHNCAYPKFSPVPFQESDLWNGYPEETNAPYGLAKRMLLVLLQAYRQQYGFEGIYLLPVNLFGPGDSFDLEAGHVIPVLIRKFIEAKKAGTDKVTLWGDGSPTREFLYVTDAAKGILHMAEHYQGAEPINLGTGREISIQHLADLLREIIGYRGTIIWDTSQPNGQPRRCLDVSRAAALGWRAEVELEQGLFETVSWYLRHN